MLVNNAGTHGPWEPFEDVRTEDWRRTIDVNVTGYFLCAQAAFKLMRRQARRGGRIINNGSVSAYSPRPNSIAYTTSKHAITGLTKAIALEGRGYGIACGQVDLGNVATDMTHQIRQGALQPDRSIMAEPSIDVVHAARLFVYLAALPLEANIQFCTLLATSMPFIGRG